MQAGTKNLIASVWKVYDRVTEKMMVEFYKNYSNGMQIDEALWHAQKSIKNNPRTRHPKYWAGWFLLSN
jgi:CHAT domain-containing protein